MLDSLSAVVDLTAGNEGKYRSLSTGREDKKLDDEKFADDQYHKAMLAKKRKEAEKQIKDKLQADLVKDGISHALSGTGAGVVEAFVNAMEGFVGKPIVLVEYSEHALSHSADAEAICYIQLNIEGERVCGGGV